MVFKELKTNDQFMTLMYYPLFCLRRQIFALTMLVFAYISLLQSFTQILLHLAFFTYTSYFKPFKSHKLELIVWYNEACILGVYMIFPVFLLALNESAEYTYGLLVQVVVTSSVLVCLGMQAREVYLTVSKLISRMRRKRTVLK
mmetsp:Transcript_3218/g.6625  ORF Transcript_3218/g.6625 Transcript_3218/m.6625 type:complete len:144 (+) Transcript_3218:325-756(+)